jgi:hypothetical protein
MVTNKINGLKYIGGTKVNYLTRWSNHISDAKAEAKKEAEAEKNDTEVEAENTTKKVKKNNCSKFHKAINEYGRNGFEIIKLHECSIDEIDTYEQQFIKKYDTSNPEIGYNMSSGGKTAVFTEEARENMSQGQVGKRYKHVVERKHEEDRELPKYITPIRKNGVITGYKIKKFPIGVDGKEYIEKTFRNKANPPAALEKAKSLLEEFKITFTNKCNIKQNELDMQELATKLHIPTLPKYINAIIADDQITGYYVKDMRTSQDKLIPRKDFETLQSAIQYVHETEKINSNNKKFITAEPDLPLHIYKTTYKGIPNGYRARYITGYDDNKKPIYTEKRFTDANTTMEVKLELAIQHLESFKI